MKWRNKFDTDIKVGDIVMDDFVDAPYGIVTKIDEHEQELWCDKWFRSLEDLKNDEPNIKYCDSTSEIKNCKKVFL